MELLKTLIEEEFPVKMFSITEAEVDLYLLNKEGTRHSYYPELERKIQEVGDVMKRSSKRKSVSVEAFLDGIFQEALVEYGEKRVSEAVHMFDTALRVRFEALEKRLLLAPKQKRFKIKREEFASILVDNCRNIHLGREASKYLFSSDMIYDSYLFSLSKSTSLDFLTEIHRKKVIKGDSIEKVEEYVRERYSSDALGCDTYNDRIVFVVLFHLIRGGMYKEAVEFVERHHGFFKEICRNFTEALLLWMDSLGMIDCSVKRTNGWEELPDETSDPFKLFFFRMFQEENITSRPVINTIEDFLWYQVIMDSGSGEKRRYTKEKIFQMVKGSLSASRVFLSALMLKQWEEAIEVLYDDGFKSGEVLFLCYGISKRLRLEHPAMFPVQRGSTGKEGPPKCIGAMAQIIQEISSLFLKPEEKLSVIQILEPFIASEWMEDLVAEVFISSENFEILGTIDEQGRKQGSTLQEYINLPVGKILDRISGYYVHGGDLDKALKISYLGDSDKTLQILTDILMEKIKKEEFSDGGISSIISHFNSAFVNMLWSIVKIGTAKKEELLPLIRSTGLIPSNNSTAALKKAQEIFSLSPEMREVVGFALALIARKIKETSCEERNELGKSLLLLVGVLDIDQRLMQKIISDISTIL
ncbi:hypothetical protein NEFER03_0481 [Nematocida sp. LUAm3]|nr:hypothetical protein NEFER03_0481 [Nematocida sp. LUAm3]KAI5175938.1 hypothetical protein NEFER02_1798 [Nematocida sp. LUAm2]KAI5178680.1 hypothetical protein NEFER01_1799 [Nematocida sp. LUAm1]